MSEVFQTVDQLFEKQADLRPDALALKCGDERLTYAELNRAANQLAHRIREHGVQSGFAAIYMDRSHRTIIAILAALKAGLAYVPIDLAYPKDRVEFMLEDTKPAVLLSEKAVQGKIDFQGLTILVDEPTSNAQEDTNPSRNAQPNGVAYVIFTSGSTGKPKGVMVSHRNLARLFSSTDHWYHFNEKDVWSVFHSFAFDFSVWEMWGALVYGGTAIVVPYLVSRSPQAFYELVAREKVTVLNQTPSAFRQFIQAEEATPFKAGLALRYVVFGGEALELQSLRPWFDRHGDEQPRLINMYGITETTVHVTYRPIGISDVEQNLGSVIGEPIPDLEIALLDEKQNPVPVGQEGEIYVGGAGVANGYLNRPELTSQRFVNDSVDKNSGKIFYRSGDLARRLPNGDLEYLGRIDHQVKIRGFRIELGEIEAALNAHPGIRESVVIAQDAGNGEKRLVAYVVCREQRVPIESIREHVGKKLPQYMLPAAVVFLDALPLTINGKVDRKALPDPARSRPELQTSYVAPGTEKEKALAAIWREVLQIEEIGVHDNFFAIGGDSIRSIQILAKAQLAGWQLTLEDLFQKPTIHELAQVRRESTIQEISAHRIPFELVPAAERSKLPKDIEDAYPAARLQSGMVFHSDYQRGSAVFHDVFSFRLKLPFNELTLRQAVDRLVQRHAIYRTGFDLHNFKQPMQIVHKHAEAPITVEDLRGLSTEQQRQTLVNWVETEKRCPFDWQKPPLMRLHVQRLRDDAFQFIVSFHHVIMDGWSLAAMLAELFQDYAKLQEGKNPDIASPRVTYRDFIVLENASARSPEVIHFWKKLVEGSVVGKVPRWPHGTFRKGLEQVRGPEIYFEKDLFEKIRQLANKLGVPVRTPLLAAHCKVMGFLTGQKDVTTGLVANGRPQTVDGERLIGLFLNTLPFRARIDQGTWSELIQRVFDLERQILPHRRMPMADIQQFTGGQALFETAFDFVQFHVYRDLPGYKEQSFLEDHYFEANSFTLFTTFMVDASGDALQMHFDYDPNELCEEQVKFICEYYLNTLKEMVAQSEKSCGTEAPLSQEELQNELRAWNDTASEELAPDPVELMHKFAEEHAEKEALVCGDKRFSYEKLSTEVRDLTAELRNLGLGPESLVGIHCTRGSEMLISVLAALDAGAAYVPLDPAFPHERLKYMVEDSGLKFVLTQSDFAANVIEFGAQPLLVKKLLADAGCQKVIEHAHDDALAYVLYTSGSTGKPKGVQVERGALRNFLVSMQSTPGLKPEDRLLAITTLSFDIAALELLLPLATGASVVLADSKQTKDPAALIEIIQRERINVMQGTPGIWRALLENGWNPPRGFKALCGGEAMPVVLARDLRERGIELWNMYGPTETTVWSAVQKVDKSLMKGSAAGLNAVKVTAITPLKLKVSYEGTAGSLAENSLKYMIAVTKETDKAGKQTRTGNVGSKNALFKIEGINGPPENPTEVTILLDKETEPITITPTQPYERVIGYAADIFYEPDKLTKKNLRPRDEIAFGGETYNVVAITQNELILSAKSNKKQTPIEFKPQ